MTTEEKKIKEAIISSLLHGRHSIWNIISFCGLERKAKKACKALAELECDGLIEFHSRNEAKESGYFLTEKGELALPIFK